MVELAASSEARETASASFISPVFEEEGWDFVGAARSETEQFLWCVGPCGEYLKVVGVGPGPLPELALLAFLKTHTHPSLFNV